MKISDMTAVEIRSAINAGKEIIEEHKKAGEEVPEKVYIRLISLYEELAGALSIGE